MRELSSLPASRLAALRAWLKRSDLDGFVIPRWDGFQGEYVRPRDERIAFLTGFTGSWGLVAVLRDRAALFVDGRYTVQAREQVQGRAFELRHLIDEPVETWLAEASPAGARIGFDPAVLTPELHDRLKTSLEARGGELRAASEDPFDAIWTDRPDTRLTPVEPFPDAGESGVEKRRRLAEALRSLGVRYLAESQTDNIAWAFNIRAADLAYTPVAQAYAVFGDQGEAYLFLDEARLTAPRDAYDLEATQLRPLSTFFQSLGQIVQPGDKVALDPRFSPIGARQAVLAAGGRAVLAPNPLTRLKAPKNPVELAQMRAASRRDAVAWVRLLRWLHETVAARAAADQPLVELEVEQQMDAFRRESPLFVGSSFRTIAASDASGAMCHYAAPESGGRPVKPDSILLLDVGSQYRDGTTDTTRTLTFAPPPAHVRRAYTAVLQGHAALARQTFPDGSFGHQLDPIARAPLWRLGLDYDHGTGHGVGHFLSVHEFPQRLAKQPSDAALCAGMTLTNEPGYYEAGAFGIRIENLCEIVAAATPGFLRLEPMTLVPISRWLLDVEALSLDDVNWIDAYHARVRAEIRPLLDDPRDRAWLQFATAPLAHPVPREV